MMKRKNNAILILDALPGKIRWTVFNADSVKAASTGEFGVDGPFKLRDCPAGDPSLGRSIRMIAIHTPFGGQHFNRPVVLNAEHERLLHALTGQAPLHVPAALAAINGCRHFFPRVKRVLFCETAFYANLPERENSYALSKSALGNQTLRRYGHHGLYHEAAARKAADLLNPARPQRILSFCVDFRAELAAVTGGRPVMVTGGLSPLEGLPGMTMCGDLDPSIVLTFHEKKHWGPERINRVLTESSGLFGLAGARITFEELLLNPRWKDSLARHLIEYRFMLAVGAGIAAMGGVDCLAFSGRFAAAAEDTLGQVVRKKISGMLLEHTPYVPTCCLLKSNEEIMADYITTGVSP